MALNLLRDLLRRVIRVLIIDDNADAADSLAMLLELLGFQVRVASDGATGLRVAAEWEPRCVLLDIRMPGMNGYEVAHRLRAIPGLGSVKIVALSAFSDASHINRLADTGFDHFFVKPADPEAVFAFLNSID
jgi:CheY-like chemotaxis protein